MAANFEADLYIFLLQHIERISVIKCKPSVISGSIFGGSDMSSVERQKGSTTNHLHKQLDPFASKLTIYCGF